MEPPLVLTREQVRRVDALAVERYGMSSLVLMENAGRGVVDVLLRVDPSLLGNPHLAPHTPPPAPPRLGEGSGKGVAILCGKGNNAGDGFVIARHLDIHGVHAKVMLLGPPYELRGDARKNYDILTHAGFPIVDLSKGPLGPQFNEHAGEAAWLVDALLGTGATGDPRPPLDAAIDWMNAQNVRRLAVDIPSGLDCDTGAPAAATVRADVTCTFVAMKPGFLARQAQPFLGQVHVVSIGVPPRLVREAAAA